MIVWEMTGVMDVWMPTVREMKVSGATTNAHPGCSNE